MTAESDAMQRGGTEKSMDADLENRTSCDSGGNYTYILLCADHTLYTGWTNDLENRVRTHNSGAGAKYTRSRLPVKLVYWEVFPTKKEAMAREYAIKQLSRKQKETLISGWKAPGPENKEHSRSVGRAGAVRSADTKDNRTAAL